MPRSRPLLAAVSAALLLPAVALADPAPSGVVAPNENLLVDGVPPVPATVAEKASRYGEFRAATLADWSPDGKAMLILTRFGDTNQIHLVRTPGGARTQLTFFPDRVEGAQFDPIHGNYVVLHKGAGGAEFFQNYRYDFSDGSVTLLTDGKSRNSSVTFSHDGVRAAYTSTRRNGTDTDLYLQFPLDPKTDRLLAEVKGGGWEVLDWSPDGKTLLVREAISITQSFLWLVDTATGEKSALTPRQEGGESVAYGEARFARDGKGVFLTTNEGAEFMGLAYLPTGGKLLPLTARLPHDVTAFDLSEDGQRLAFVANEEGLSGLYQINNLPATVDIATKVAADKLDQPSVFFSPIAVTVAGAYVEGRVITGLKWARDGKQLGISLATAGIPGDCFAIDLTGGGEFERWTTSETGGLPTGVFSRPKLVRWPSFDGREISGFLYAPDAAKFPGKRPVIVNIHGGPEAQYRPGFLGRNNYLINELGCAIVFPNVRGSDGYGKTFVSLDNGLKRDDSYKDIDALLDWIKTQPGLDAGRIMVTGGSYGGHMTLAVSTFYADKIRCSVDVVGMSNLRTFLEHTESYRRDLRRVEYGDERDPQTREYLERIAPMNNAQKITKPMFVVQGYNDPRVPRSEAEQIVATLKGQGTPVWFLMAKDEGHGFAKKKNADFQFYATVAFIERYLLGGE